MNRRGTEPYARWCERTGEVTPPPTRYLLLDNPEPVLAPATDSAVPKTGNAPKTALIHGLAIAFCPFAPALIVQSSLCSLPIQTGAFNDHPQAGVGL